MLCVVAALPVRANDGVFTSADAYKAMSAAIDLYLEPNGDLHNFFTYYVMPDGSTYSTRSIAAKYSPPAGEPGLEEYLPPMLRFFPRLEASFDSIFNLTNGRTPGALGSIIGGDDMAIRVLRFSRQDSTPVRIDAGVNPYDNMYLSSSPERSDDYEQTILIRRQGPAIEVTHFYSTPPDSTFLRAAPLAELDREFSLLVTARQAEVANVSYNSEETMSGALHVRPLSDTRVKGVKVTLPQVSDEVWKALRAKVMSLVSSRNEVSLYYGLNRPYSSIISIEAYVVDYATSVIYAFYYDDGRLTVLRATYDGTPFLPEGWHR